MRITIDPSPKPDLDIDEVIAQAKVLEPSAEERAARDELLRLFYSVEAELAERYPNQWIAFHAGRVVAACDSHSAVLSAVDRLGVSRRAVKFQHFPVPRPSYFL